MTLIVTISTPSCVIQAGDRLITRNVTGRIEEVDAQSNKSVLYEASDGLLAISYCGNAYIEGRPTDEWLAGLLHANVRNMFADGPNPAAVQLGPLPPQELLSVDRVLQQLRESLEKLEPPFVAHNGVSVSVAGWKVKDDNAEFIAVEFSRRRGSLEGVVGSGFKRRLPTSPNSCVSWIGSGSTDDVQGAFEAAWNEIHARNPPTTNDEAAALISDLENTIIGAIRLAAEQDATVGPDVYITTLPRPYSFPIRARTRFVSDVEHPATILTPTRHIHVPDAAATGWVLTPTGCLAPSYLVGTHQINGRISSIALQGAARQGNVGGLLKTIPRQRF
ncbi:hypothetical protein [Paraburkholderia phenoliruptrix]|uniref:hypothetical protein n=1 Tax=Paraburkholderia phenoliruptrix TaxID=252970 RepID=UPI0034CEC315